MTTYIYSYNPHSASAKALAEGLGIKRIKHQGSKYVGKDTDTIINWGSSILPVTMVPCTILNNQGAIEKVTNKLSFFEMVDKELTVPYVAGVHAEAQVRLWLDGGKTVVARQKLTGHSGDGIVVFDKLYVDNGNPVPPAPLYTLYTPKKHEYRVHCYRHKVDMDLLDSAYMSSAFDVQRKARKLDVPDEEVDWKVRNLAGGFIYQRENLTVPDVVTDVALKVFEQTGLDFGAVDIIYQDKGNKAYALEINTAPGLTGTTLENYVEMFKGMI